MTIYQWWERLRRRFVRPDSDATFAMCEVVLAQSFGARESDPGESNRALAQVVRELHERHGLAMVLQWEVAECLPDLTMAGVIRSHRTPGKYLDSWEVMFQSWYLCRKHEWKRAIVVAHPDHAWRVARTAQKLGFGVAIADTAHVPYDPQSTQAWTRGPARFLVRELAAVGLFFVRGWI